MKNYQCLLMLLLITIAACKSKQDNNPDTNIPPPLYNAYPKLKLPFSAVDSTMGGKARDTSISLQTFRNYFPDSIFNTAFGSDRNITLRPVGKIEQKKENYFLTLVKGQKKTVMYLSVYDSNHHIVTMPLITNEADAVTQSASIDKKLTIVVNKEWMVKNDLYYNRMIYAYNNVGIFTTVLTETNEQRRADAVVLNPLDTFPKRNKYSSDYTRGSKNHLFIRDGANANEYLFFVHFQNANKDESCNGELKGKFKMMSENTGQYSITGEPCSIIFTFKGNEVQVKENGSCGNYRDIKCFFTDTYVKKKSN